MNKIIICLIVFVFIFINASIIEGEDSLKKDLIIKNKNNNEFVGQARLSYDKTDNKENNKINNELQNKRRIIMEVTAYTAGYESTGKTLEHPEYGITASGNKVKPHYTVAASRSIPFGTRLRIPEYEEFMGLDETILVVEDRGSAITKGKLDIYIKDLETALNWGRRKVEVIFID